MMGMRDAMRDAAADGQACDPDRLTAGAPGASEGTE